MVDWKVGGRVSISMERKVSIAGLTMGNDAHVPDVVLPLHKLIYLVYCGPSALWTTTAMDDRIHTDGEVTGYRAGNE